MYGQDTLHKANSKRQTVEGMWTALLERRFFKLIGGGSFTEIEKLKTLARIYGLSGVDCIDIAPELQVVEAVSTILKELAVPAPVVMVSVPLDPDPHFRKIELDEPACITCGLCLPVCPTEAIRLPDVLAISQSLCYGCGRCVPVCPTEALALLPFQVEAQIDAVLCHPAVQAVEIHSRYVDPYMLESFWERWEERLEGKLISLCFRLEGIPKEQVLVFCETAERLSSLPILLQIDGAPMSGNEDPEASRPALESAVILKQWLDEKQSNHWAAHPEHPHPRPQPPITISGGINQHTATLLQDERYAFIAGVGMGTVARQKVWALAETEALHTAGHLVAAFKIPR